MRLTWLRSKWLAIGWLLLMCIFFFLPGSDLPKETEWLSSIHFDKLVHFTLFLVLFFLWRTAFSWRINNYDLFLFILTVAFGFAVEIIQGNWIPGRTFDLYDLAADAVGSLTGLIVRARIYKKNKPL